MNNIEETIAHQLLQIKAIKLQPANPFTWASGWLSPIYCDNRKTLSYPEVRTYIRDRFADEIRAHFADVEVIAGVATGAIAQGALVADVLGKPFIYVRSSPKGHGLENLVEGKLLPGQKVVVIEDLISTGGSSLKAVDAIRNSGAEVLGMVAIFSYGFQLANQQFEEKKVKLKTLSNYKTLIKVAVDTGYVTSEEVETLEQWRQNPSQWKK
ncbi:MAG TPA: orotate phosphoribosyltransferase [Marinilabiliaceae bacterium]|nr:orotate phosphoribosyltransferase [Marinilabiliaceae bacterium]